MARTFGMVLYSVVVLWDLDAMRSHIAAHSWVTLSYVAVFLIGHVGDYLTVGRLINKTSGLFN